MTLMATCVEPMPNYIKALALCTTSLGCLALVILTIHMLLDGIRQYRKAAK